MQTVLTLHLLEMKHSPNEPAGVIDPGLLESAIAAPINHYIYSGVDDICALAAIYAEKIALSHAFVSGNKRTALAACIAFLVGNGYQWTRRDEALGKEIERIVLGTGNWLSLADFLRSNAERTRQ